ncbi:hypothetical protein H7849_00635 [Alloacidobacterium dinghuense]|uniref:Histidine kinase/HSP90-like ATPase domain-containing protein n=1 Tax=Alloacidobacterium dinghuense TaxID=2763107 RepID=A0A7G8BJ51_9BACT|nr:two-component regulator propeller domain-containing protein [Alloacidobacterium dinghuense]QNI32571.1 hypothetical protein H7849_00635 [Alloacidobacterium dinghuense]
MLLLALCASAQQFSVTSWGHKDGLPSTTVYALTQTKDGFLWIGTGDGLIRFDGFQFVQLEMPSAALNPLGSVTTLVAINSDGLLIGTVAGRLINWNGKIEVHTTLDSAVEHVQEMVDHTFEVKTHNKIFHLGNTLSTISSEAISDLQADRTKERTLAQTVHLNLFSESAIRKILHGAGGATWLATENEGLFRIGQRGDIQHFTNSTGLPSDHISDIFEDREGNIWVGTQNGLARLRQDKFITYTTRDGLLSDIANSLVPASDGGIWISSRSGLEHFAGAGSTHDIRFKGRTANNLLLLKDGALLLSTPAGIERLFPRETHSPQIIPDTQHIEQMAQSENGDIWLYGQQVGLWHSRSGSKPERVNEPALVGQVVACMHGGQRDQVWLGLDSGEVVQRPFAGSHIFATADGLTGGAIRFLSPQPDGTLWVASDKGLAFFDGEHFHHWNRSSGLPGDRLIWAIPDQRGNLWLGYSTGIARLSVSELLQPSSRNQPQYDFYDDGDGLKSNPEAHGNSPVALTSDGRLWTSMSEGIGVIDLAHVHLNAVVPPVHILDLTADGHSLAPVNGVRIPAHTRTLQISYTGISLTEPRKVRFRYRLQGFESDWQDPGSRRNAFYTNLHPRLYRFQVLAANNDGIWNETGDSVTFDILPAFYQTRWFLVLCTLVILSLIFITYRLRIRFAARELRARYEERLAERTRIAQDLHDNLIQEMMGISLQLEIADEVTDDESTAKGPIRRAVALSQAALANGRDALHILRQKPFSRTDIENTLRDTAQSMTGSKEAIRFAISGKERPIQALTGEEIVQILREALRNAIQHGVQSEIIIRSEYGEESVTFVLRDNGPGIREEILREGKPGHFGIRGMRERAGRIGSSLTLNSSASTGTEWTLHVPAKNAYEAEDIPMNLPTFERFLQSIGRFLTGRRRP